MRLNAGVAPEMMRKPFIEDGGITDAQRAVNEREWRRPENWKGRLFPAYRSSLDSRPFVPARAVRPRSKVDMRGVGVLCNVTANRGHPRGRIWTLLAWGAVGAVCAAYLIAVGFRVWSR